MPPAGAPDSGIRVMNVSKNERSLAQAEGGLLTVVREPSAKDTESWAYLSQHASPATAVTSTGL